MPVFKPPECIHRSISEATRVNRVSCSPTSDFVSDSVGAPLDSGVFGFTYQIKKGSRDGGAGKVGNRQARLAEGLLLLVACLRSLSTRAAVHNCSIMLFPPSYFRVRKKTWKGGKRC